VSFGHEIDCSLVLSRPFLKAFVTQTHPCFWQWLDSACIMSLQWVWANLEPFTKNSVISLLHFLSKLMGREKTYKIVLMGVIVHVEHWKFQVRFEPPYSWVVWVIVHIGIVCLTGRNGCGWTVWTLVCSGSCTASWGRSSDK
jgi:hypothetical protein